MAVRLPDEMKKLYEEKKQSLINKGVALDPLVYFEFTYFYFPEFINKIDRLELKYFDFVDDMLDRKQMLDMWFRERKTVKEMMEYYKVKELCIRNRLERSKTDVKRFLQLYKESLNNKNKRMIKKK